MLFFCLELAGEYMHQWMRVVSFAYRDRYSKCVLSLFYARLGFLQGRPKSKGAAHVISFTFYTITFFSRFFFTPGVLQ